MKSIKILTILFFLLIVAAAAAFADVAVKSPDGRIEARLTVESGRLSFSMDRDGVPVILPSPMGVKYDEFDLGTDAQTGEPARGNIDETYPTRGAHSTAVNRCNTAAVPVIRFGQVSMTVELRVFDDGAAYRYIIPGRDRHTIHGESSSWRLPADAVAWYQNNLKCYEGNFIKSKAGDIKKDTKVGLPVTFQMPDGSYAVIGEAAVYDYSGISLYSSGDGLFSAEFLDDPDGIRFDRDVRTPWRFTIVSKDLNGIFNSDMMHNLTPAPEPELADADWIKPGRSLWSWLNGGRSSVTPENMRKYVDIAAELGYEYVLVDDGWEGNRPVDKRVFGWGEPEGSPFDVMEELVDYAESRGVGIWIWKHYYMLRDPKYRDDYFKKMSDLGVVGMKIDFMDSESRDMINFYESALREAANYKLMVNFHGANKPAGETRRYPNEIAREGVRGMEYRGLMPDHPCTLPFTRFVANGHGDFTPMHFNKSWMSTTSWSYQIATALVFPTYVTFYGANPQDILDNPAVEVLKKLPTTFDETIVLPKSKIGRFVAMARRAGDNWYVALMNAGPSRKFTLPLDFLGDGEYAVTAIYDSPKDSAALKIRRGTMKKGDEIPVTMRSNGGGFVAVFEKAE